MVKISPSLLSANFVYLQKDIASIEEAGADWLHYDVMDGHFVNNISFGYSILKDVSKVTDLFLDVHLMISHPKQYIQQFIDSKASLITFHIEAIESDEEVNELIDIIHKNNVKVGISIKPNTPVSRIVSFLDQIDLVLVMSVEPGFGGQAFQQSAVDKITQLVQLKHDNDFLIEVDGGINEETGQLCKEAGVDVLVAGSYIFNATDRKKAIDSLK